MINNKNFKEVYRKGIILSGGTGSRLFPLTNSVSKQILPLYDKPMIYYSLSILMLAGIREILIIVDPNQKDTFENLLNNGEELGIKINYEIQQKPEGIAQAFLIGSDFLNNQPSALILGDNFIHGSNLTKQLVEINSKISQNTIFAYAVKDPERYGIVEFDKNGKAFNIEEKPSNPKSNYAITGLYFYDSTVVKKAESIKPSKRGELEITSLNNLYLKEGNLNVEIFSRGTAWLDTGTFDSLHEAGSYIKTLQNRQGQKICCPEEIAWRNKWIDKDQLEILAKRQLNSGYGKYLLNILESSNY